MNVSVWYKKYLKLFMMSRFLLATLYFNRKFYQTHTRMTMVISNQYFGIVLNSFKDIFYSTT